MKYHLLPRFLQVELTYDCNSACVFCYNPSRRSPPSSEHTRAILRELATYDIPHVQLIGGEVTTIPELAELAELLAPIEWVSMVTNGRKYAPDVVPAVNEAYISLHGEAAIHENITNAAGSFSTIEDTIRRYVGEGLRVHSDTVLTQANADQIFGIAQRAHELGMSSMFVNIFQPSGYGASRIDLLTPTLDQISGAITQMLRARDELGFPVRFGTSTPFCLDERLVTEGLAFRCGTGDWFGSIDPWGEVRICNQSTKSYGNVLTEPLHEIWHKRAIGDDYRNLAWVEEPCRSCCFMRECLGGCRVDSSGTARIDPLIERNKGRLVSYERLRVLKENHFLASGYVTAV